MEDSNIYLEAYQTYKDTRSYSEAGKILGIDPRTVKRRIENYFRHPEFAALGKESEKAGIDPTKVSHFWYKTRNEEGYDVSLFVKNDMSMSFDEMRDELVNSLMKHAPKYEKIKRETSETNNLLVIDPADVHIGKLAISDETGDHDYNIDIAVDRVKEAVTQLVLKAKAFGIGHIALVIGNDILHIDRPHRMTTSGTPQDTDGQWWQMFLAAKQLYIQLLEQLTQIADVSLVYCPSNHDYVLGFLLADTIYSWFRNNPNVHFTDRTINHRKYIKFGNNLIGFTHGDGAKEKDLPSLMQYEAREAWGGVQYAYWYVHHYHHKIRKSSGMTSTMLEKDHIGVTVLDSNKLLEPENNVFIEYVRSPSPADGWHSRNGYVNKQAIEAFLHDPENGQIARFTHYF